MKKFLVIQTAFLGDVVLATGVLGSIHAALPNAQIDFLIRKGNEGLIESHPFIHKNLLWDKKKNKYKNLFKLLKAIRNEKYDIVINLHRFGASGFLTGFSGAKEKRGFSKNPFSFLFDKKYEHLIGEKNNIESYAHETYRNSLQIADFVEKIVGPQLHPSLAHQNAVEAYLIEPFVCVAPASVWFTKQWPKEKWVELISKLKGIKVYILGAPSDERLAEEIITGSQATNVFSLCGKLSLLESAALMQRAGRVFANDSAPLHMASAVGVPVSAIFCSTIPEFGFTPQSSDSEIWQTKENLDCRPCGLHGHKECPKGHFKCADIAIPDELHIAEPPKTFDRK